MSGYADRDRPFDARSIVARIRSLALVASLLALAGCTPAPVPDAAATIEAYPTLAGDIAQLVDDPSPSPQAQASMADQALAVLAELPIDRKTEWDGPFDRVAHFGEGWADLDGDSCNTRQEVLADELEHVALNRDGCRVDSGVLDDPYSGETIRFQRGEGTSDLVQIDHVVAVYNAWRTGAQDLTQDERIRFANDPMNLQAVAGWVNDDKMSQDASQWLPPNAAYQCTYVARQIVVKASYGLWVTENEHATMQTVLEGCRNR